MLKINLYQGRKKRKLFGGASPKFTFDVSFGDRVVVFSLILAGVIVALSAASYLYNRHTIQKLNDEIEVAVADSTRFAESIKLYNEIREREGWIRNRIDVIRMVDQNRYLWPKLMAEINDAIPSVTWMTRLETISPFPNLVFRIEGVSFSNIEVANFMRRLEQLHYIDHVRLISTKEHLIEKIPTMAFAIECSLGREPNGTTETSGGKGDRN